MSFSHSPESWKHLWENVIFKKGEVVCESFLSDKFVDTRLSTLMMIWSVRRVSPARRNMVFRTGGFRFAISAGLKAVKALV